MGMGIGMGTGRDGTSSRRRKETGKKES